MTHEGVEYTTISVTFDIPAPRERMALSPWTKDTALCAYCPFDEDGQRCEKGGDCTAGADYVWAPVEVVQLMKDLNDVRKYEEEQRAKELENYDR
jgi:hypothetical protein